MVPSVTAEAVNLLLVPAARQAPHSHCGPAILTPVYGWFTEGFDSLDLQEAKALLDELHA